MLTLPINCQLRHKQSKQNGYFKGRLWWGPCCLVVRPESRHTWAGQKLANNSRPSGTNLRCLLLFACTICQHRWRQTRMGGRVETRQLRACICVCMGFVDRDWRFVEYRPLTIMIPEPVAKCLPDDTHFFNPLVATPELELPPHNTPSFKPYLTRLPS